MSKILIIGLNFYPELTGIGKYTGEMAAYLSQCGHQIRVVTTPHYYPYWQVQAGYKSLQYRRETWKNIHIFRTPLWVPRKPSGIKRLLHLFSFALSSFPILIGQLFWNPDLILCVAPAFFSAPFAWLTARLCGAKAWLHIQDFELDAATRLGLLPTGNFLARIASFWESWLLRRFDRVSTISDGMLARLKKKGVPSERTYLLPNWIQTQFIFPEKDRRNTLRREWGISEESIVALYAGSMGNKQGLEDLVTSARQLQNMSRLQFILCGEGSSRTEIEELAKSLSNVKFFPLQPLEKLNCLLNTADIHILPQKAGIADYVMPSKLLGMLASGKPVIAMADPGTEIGRLVSEVGILIPPGDPNALCESILALMQSSSKRSDLGKKGRALVCKNWDAESILGKFEETMQLLIVSKGRSRETD